MTRTVSPLVQQIRARAKALSPTSLYKGHVSERELSRWADEVEILNQRWYRVWVLLENTECECDERSPCLRCQVLNEWYQGSDKGAL